MLTLYAGALGAVLTVAVTWQQLDFLPRWAWHSEVVALEQFSVGTRLIVLGQEWEQLDQKIRSLANKPNRSRIEDEALSKMRHRLQEIDAQLKALRQKKEI